MSSTTPNAVSTVRVVGGIMPGDVISRVVAGDLPGMTPSDYHLASGEQVRAAASRAWTALQAAYTGYQDELTRLPADQTATALTRDKWLQQLMVHLGYGRVPVTPGGHLKTGADGDEREYPVSHLWGDIPMHLLGWNLDLDKAHRGIAGAARAPQSMLQEFLNRSDDHLWAVLSNGRTLRLLRDSSALVGQAYVEFDLQTMFDGELFSDFVVLYLLCHQSRLERLPDADGQPGGVADRWIERWRSDAIATGTRALAGMRAQVEKAIEALGTGFYAHPANTALRDRLESGDITPADYQRALLRVIYRLLFWFVAEDRGLLLDPAADPTAQQRYTDYYSSARLRRIAARRIGTRHDDLWQQVDVVLNGLGNDTGRPELGLPALGGLFENGPMDVLTDARISNSATLEAIRLLSHTQDKASRRRLAVDFTHLGAEELGGIYEGLLELHPRLDPGQRRFTLEAAAGNERKTSGSYYTPADLIALVLDEALDPVLDEAITSKDPEQALLGVTVCDPACGSGHFLVAAAKRIAVRLAQVRSGESEPTPTQEQQALRDVVTACIHGVDINPMAAELAKVSLWLEAVDPGKPLAFLDANIRVGNALLGTTPALLANGVPDDAFKALTGDDKPTVTALKKRNKTERTQHDQAELFGAAEIPVSNTDLAARARAIDAAAQGSTLADTHLAAQRLRDLEKSPERRHATAIADAWCAAFTQPKTVDTAPIAVTDAVMRRWGTSNDVDPHTRDIVAAEARQHRFFHWHLEFPDIFHVDPDGAAANEQGWSGGFTVMIGNPPWETVQLTEKEFFAESAPAIAAAPTAAKRRKMIDELARTDPELHSNYLSTLRQTEAGNELVRGGRYPLTARGKINTYGLFAETFRDLVNHDGRCGFITPTGLATDASTAPFIASALASERLIAFYDFENEAKIFAGVHNQFRFACTCLTGGTPAGHTQFAFYTRFIRDVPSRRFELKPAEALMLNPNTGTLPVFRTRRDAEITLGVYRRHPILIRDADPTTGEPGHNPWGLSFKQGLFNMASDSNLFRTADDLDTLGATFDGWAWHKPTPDGSTQTWLPLYEAKMLSHWDHRFATYRDATQAQLNKGTLPRLTDAQHDDAAVESLARYWVPTRNVTEAVADRTNGDWLIGWRDITNASNERTMVPSVLPRAAVGNKFPLAWIGPPGEAPLLQCLWSSLAFDYVARQKLSGTGMTYFILKQIACPAPDSLAASVAWLDESLAAWIVPRVLELTYTSYRILGYARDLGDGGESFRWIPERRFAIRAELDAAMMHVYGLQRDEIEHVLDSFPVLRKYEDAPPEKGGFGEFRTKRMVLEFYDLMAAAAASGTPYETPINPPPGQGPRHAPR